LSHQANERFAMLDFHSFLQDLFIFTLLSVIQLEFIFLGRALSGSSTPSLELEARGLLLWS
jgi:hypothetical protein